MRGRFSVWINRESKGRDIVGSLRLGRWSMNIDWTHGSGLFSGRHFDTFSALVQEAAASANRLTVECDLAIEGERAASSLETVAQAALRADWTHRDISHRSDSCPWLPRAFKRSLLPQRREAVGARHCLLLEQDGSGPALARVRCAVPHR